MNIFCFYDSPNGENNFVVFFYIMARLAPVQAQFDEISLVEIGARFKHDLPRTIAWGRQHGLLATRVVCPICGHHCNEQNAPAKIDRVIWKCMAKRCKRKTNIRYGSFFDQSKLELWQIIGLTYLWASSAGRSRGMAQDTIRHELQIKGGTRLLIGCNFVATCRLTIS